MHAHCHGFIIHAGIRVVKLWWRSQICVIPGLGYHCQYHRRYAEMEHAHKAIASTRGIARLKQRKKELQEANVSLGMEQAFGHERNWFIHLQVPCGFNYGFYWHSTSGINIMSGKGGRMDNWEIRCTTLLQISFLSLDIMLPCKILGFRVSTALSVKSLWGIVVDPFLESDLLSCQPRENTNTGMERRKDPQAPAQENEMELKDIENQHKMFIRICTLNSLVSFSLETLAQHRILIGQLQDEVDALKRQNEDLKRRLDQNERDREKQPSVVSANTINSLGGTNSRSQRSVE
jgi:hypothetical protein